MKGRRRWQGDGNPPKDPDENDENEVVSWDVSISDWDHLPKAPSHPSPERHCVSKERHWVCRSWRQELPI